MDELGKEVNISFGHIHSEDEKVEGNIKEFVTPSACYQAKGDSEVVEVITRITDTVLLRLISERLTAKWLCSKAQGES